MFRTSPKPHLLSRMGPIFCRDLATLKRTLATGSPAIRRTVGNMCLVVISCPQTSDSTWRPVNSRSMIMQGSLLSPHVSPSDQATWVIIRFLRNTGGTGSRGITLGERFPLVSPNSLTQSSFGDVLGSMSVFPSSSGFKGFWFLTLEFPQYSSLQIIVWRKWAKYLVISNPSFSF